MKNWRGFGRIPLWSIFTQISQHLPGHIIGKKKNLCIGISILRQKLNPTLFKYEEEEKGL